MYEWKIFSLKLFLERLTTLKNNLYESDKYLYYYFLEYARSEMNIGLWNNLEISYFL